MIEIAGRQMPGPQPVIGFVGRQRQQRCGDQPECGEARQQCEKLRVARALHRVRQMNMLDMA